MILVLVGHMQSRFGWGGMEVAAGRAKTGFSCLPTSRWHVMSFKMSTWTAAWLYDSARGTLLGHFRKCIDVLTLVQANRRIWRTDIQLLIYETQQDP